jgi:hypothetical protein
MMASLKVCKRAVRREHLKGKRCTGQRETVKDTKKETHLDRKMEQKTERRLVARMVDRMEGKTEKTTEQPSGEKKAAKMAEWTDSTWEEHSGKVMVGCLVEKKELMKEFSKGIHLAEKLDHWLVDTMESALESTKDEQTEVKAADSSGNLME